MPAEKRPEAALVPLPDRTLGPARSLADRTLASLPSKRVCTGVFTPTGSMRTQRTSSAATLLSNGRVLIAGGNNTIGIGAVASAELYDPASGAFIPTGSMRTSRVSSTATLLPNGRVLVAGGLNGGGLASAELYDPASGTFTPTGSMTVHAHAHTATLLPNGHVLITGGSTGVGALASAELYDPASERFIPTRSMAGARMMHTATLLPSGHVLITGGTFGVWALRVAELYDPASGTFIETGAMTAARAIHTATLLPSGRVLITGGTSNGSNALASAELYDPASGIFMPTGSMTAARMWYPAALLPDGRVLVTGGTCLSRALASAEIYDPANSTFILAGDLTAARAGHTAMPLPDGRVLVAGGNNGNRVLAAVELFQDEHPDRRTGPTIVTPARAAAGSASAPRRDHVMSEVVAPRPGHGMANAATIADAAPELDDADHRGRSGKGTGTARSWLDLGPGEHDLLAEFLLAVNSEVAFADGRMTAKEANVEPIFQRIVATSRGDLVRQALFHLHDDYDRLGAALTARAASSGQWLTSYGWATSRLAPVADVLAQVDPDEARRYLMAVWFIGVATAEADGPLFGPKISREERETIDAIAVPLAARLGYGKPDILRWAAERGG